MTWIAASALLVLAAPFVLWPVFGRGARREELAPVPGGEEPSS